jgi:uncharacterized protein (UPF0333 family)
MRKPILILLAAVLAIGIAASYAKGSAANAERARIQQQCEIDPDCTYVYIKN